jgi:hypothetical protein
VSPSPLSTNLSARGQTPHPAPAIHLSPRASIFRVNADIPRVSASSSSAAPVCLYRATNLRTKISTVVPAAEAAKFHASYVTLIKASMSSLKKVKKAKKKARKTEG